MLRIFLFLTLTHLAISFEIKCEFVSYYHPPTNGYNCKIENQVQTNERNSTISSATGQHKIPHRTNNEVERLFYFENPKMKFLPKRYTKIFPNIVNMWIAIAPIENIYQDDFEEESKIEIFAMRSTKITSLSADIFKNLKQLEEVYLYNNKLKIIDENAFRASPKLTLVHFYDNAIEYLPHIFQHNPLMKEFDIRNNKLKIIDGDFISGLSKLTKVDLQMNFCINMISPPTVLTAVIEKAKENCQNPFDEVFKELKEEKNNLEVLNEELQSSFDEQNEAIKNATAEKHKLETEILDKTVKFVTKNAELKIQLDGMTKFVKVLQANHSDVKKQFDEIIEENESLKLNISITKDTRELYETELEEMKEKIKAAEESQLTLKKNFSSLEHEHGHTKMNLTQLEELFKNIQIDKNQMENDFINISKENEELKSNLSNLTLKENQMSDNMNNLETKETVLMVLTIIFIIALAAFIGKVVYSRYTDRKKREKMGSGYEFSYSNTQ